jgi:hypothetical protein
MSSSSTPTRYHVNPSTGKASRCRATVRPCIFAGDTGSENHYDTLGAAREAAEALLEQQYAASSVKTTAVGEQLLEDQGAGDMSRSVSSTSNGFELRDIHALGFKELAFYRSQLQEHITSSFEGKDFYTEMMPLVDQRNAADQLLKERSSSVPDDDGVDSEVYSDVSIDSQFVDGDERIGFSNDMMVRDEVRDAHQAKLVSMSHQWLSTVSSAEVAGVYHYTTDSREYARAAANGELDESWLQFERAVSDAPVVASFVTYSGVNAKQVGAMRAKLEDAGVGGRIVLDRVFSSSVNPAIVNSFTGVEASIQSWSGEEHTAGDTSSSGTHFAGEMVLEVLTDKGAAVGAVSTHPQELEVLLPKGEYKVLGVEHGVSYYWDETRFGRTAGTTVRLQLVNVHSGSN